MIRTFADLRRALADWLFAHAWTLAFDEIVDPATGQIRPEYIARAAAEIAAEESASA